MPNRIRLQKARLSVSAALLGATALTTLPSASVAEWAFGHTSFEYIDANSFVVAVSGDGNWAAGLIVLAFGEELLERGFVINSNKEYWADRYEFAVDGQAVSHESQVVGLSDDGSFAFIRVIFPDGVWRALRVGINYDEFSGQVSNTDIIEISSEHSDLLDFTGSGEFAVGRFERSSIGQSSDGDYDRNINTAFRWDQSGGLISLADSDGDGLIEYANYNGRATKAGDDFTYDERNAGGDAYVYGINSWNWTGDSYASAITPDGSVVVGAGKSIDSVGVLSNYRAFVWNSTDKIMVPFLDVYDKVEGYTTEGSSYARDVSSNGKVIVGQFTAEGFNTAFKWIDDPDVEGGVLTTLLGVADWTFEIGRTTSADFVSSNGEIVIGSTETDSDSDIFVWKQTNDQSTFEIISDSTGWKSYSRAIDVTPDASVVVGYTNDGGGLSAAFSWDAESNEMRLLSTGSTWAENSESVATSVSNDGSIIGGVYEMDNKARAFIYRTAMLDAENTVSAIADNVVAQGTAIAALGAGLRFAAETELDAGTGGQPSTVSISSKSYSDSLPMVIRLGASASSNADTGSLSFGSVSAAIGLSEEMTVGGFASLGTEASSLGGLGFDGTITSFGAFVRSTPLGGSGLTWKAALATSGGAVTISRDDSLVGTEAASGSSTLSSTAASFELGYRMAAQNRITTPFLRLAQTSTTRAAYDEDASYDFPIFYDAVTEVVTTATLGLDSRSALDENNTLRLTGGLEMDLARSNSPITGTSDIPNLTSFSIDVADIAAVQNPTRGYVGLGLTHDFGNGAAITFDLRADQNAFTATPTYSGGIAYQMKF